MTVSVDERRLGGSDKSAEDNIYHDSEPNDRELRRAKRSCFCALVQDFSPIWYAFVPGVYTQRFAKGQC